MRLLHRRALPSFAAALLILCNTAIPTHAQTAAPPKADRWEAGIQKFEAEDRAQPPVPGGNLFMGSSSIVRWPIAKSFPDLPCTNRGFGGSTFPDQLKYMDRIIPRQQPAVIVLYCGDNDLARGRTPEQVRNDYEQFVSRARQSVPDVKIVYIAIKPSGKRWANRANIVKANDLIQQAQAETGNEIYIDVWEPMLNADGTPNLELLVADQLHMSDAGYAIWNKLVRPHLVTEVKATAKSISK